ncbi:radical SAM protein [Thermoanaerobacter sp. A7A]|uniref:radical SAM protein n=1 Tax=Thermoanaerobacter sp. A7A TaxID=1350366 RepID=UPI00040EE5E6|nr:radical SAM protein [Thermoanaerobacter sp. A7A]
METVIIDNYLLLSDGENVVVYDITTRSIYKSRDSLDKIKQKIKTKNYIRTESHNVRLPKKMKEDNEDNSFLLFVGIASAETCNLACRYCYANAGTYNNINKVIMSFEDYKLLFEKILKIFPKGVVGYTFFGGEPMLGFKEIVKFVEYVTTISKKNKNIIEPRFAIVTNGTLIDQYAYEIFERYHFAVTISLDGPKEINDKMRIFRNGHRSVFETVKHNLEKCSIHRTHLLVAEATLSEFFSKVTNKVMQENILIHL